MLNKVQNIIIICLLLCCNLYSFSETNEYQISYLSVEDGLSQNEVTSIVQDKYGFMWFGTRGGLNRFDGYSFKQFKPSNIEKNSIPNPSIESLYLKDDNDILIGLKSNGAVRYQLSYEKFDTLSTPKVKDLNRVISFYQDSDKTLWVGSWEKGLLNIREDSVAYYNEIRQANAITETPNGTIWVGSNNGLYYKQTGQEKFSATLSGVFTSIALDLENSCLWLTGWNKELIRFNYKTFESNTYNITPNGNSKGYSLLNDSNGKLWIGTWGNGVFQFDKINKQIKKINIQPLIGKYSNADYDVIRGVFEDEVGDTWLGTHAGVVRLSKANNFRYTSSLGGAITNKTHINAIFVDDSGQWFIGTNGNGLFSSKDGINFQRIELSDISEASQEQQMVKSVVSHNGEIWVSTEAGLFVIDKNKDKLKLVEAASKLNSPDLSIIRKAHCLYFDNSTLWVGTQQRGALLYKRIGEQYILEKRFRATSNHGDIGDNRITSILRDKYENLWFATYKGLYRFNPDVSNFVALSQLIKDKDNLVCDIILCANIDKKGNVWYGTPCGLNRLHFIDESNLTVDLFTKANGLSDDYINGILEGDKGNIWVSHNTGISSYDSEKKQFVNYDKVDGIGDYSYSEGAFCKDKQGQLYFGGYSSLTYFNPASIQINQFNPPIVISKFTVLNKDVNVDSDGLLIQNINETKQLTLSHNELEFSFEVAALDYNAPAKNLYAYRLLGNNSEWIPLESKRSISFSNLKSGDYQLQIKGTNSNGIWSNQIKEISLTILPAPWKSKWAIVMYVIGIMLVVLLISWIGVRQERLQNNVKMEQIRNEQQQKVNDYKLSFFTNISHEFRTPLTLILAPVNELSKIRFSDLKADFYKERLSMISLNTKRLYDMVNQLLEFRKIEAGKINLSVIEVELQHLISNICLPFEQLASNRKIKFKQNIKIQSKTIFIDIERMSIVLNNLLSNAFKHVPEDGMVQFNVKENGTHVVFEICNDGKPIPKNEIEHIFKRFYQAAGNSSVGSTGIGLQLVKNYTELHHGEVSVTSEKDQPIIFSLVLKKGNEHFKAEELVHNDKNDFIKKDVIQQSSKRTSNVGTKGTKILVVDDNSEIRDYFKSFLSTAYIVMEAEDGLDAYDKITDFKPDLIISDVMMPRMDGFELCEKVKSNELTSHIPVILLTAKGSEQDQLFGTQKGADLYIKKPFLPDLLLEEIKQIIASRKTLKDKYTSLIKFETADEELTSSDAKLIEKSIKIVEKQMGNAAFSPDLLAKEMDMSSSTFYRKIKKATQQTPAGFIKSLRLKKAAMLLRDTDLSVSEIVEKIGYLDSRNFRKNFKDTYELAPLAYRKIQSESENN